MSDVSRTLTYVIECLDKSDGLLNEVATMSLWWKSDDCSDNRQKRKQLREADWTVSGAQRRVRDLVPAAASIRPLLEPLRDDLQKLVVLLETLPAMITDVSPDVYPELELKIGAARQEIERVRKRAELLLQKTQS